MRRALLAALAALTVLACGGPKPEVESVEASDVQDQATVVSVGVRNGGGDGQIRLSVTVKDRATGSVVGREQRTVEVKENERLRVAVEVHLPGGVDSVSAEAEARYPPD